MMITAPLSARLVERLGTKLVVTIGVFFCTIDLAVAMLVLSTLHTDSSYFPRDRQHCASWRSGMAW